MTYVDFRVQNLGETELHRSLFSTFHGIAMAGQSITPIGRLVNGSLHIMGSSPDSNCLDFYFQSSAGSVRHVPMKIGLKPETSSTEHLVPALGYEMYSRFATLGTHASINYAHQNRERNCVHLNGNGTAKPVPRGVSQVWSRSEACYEQSLSARSFSNDFYGISVLYRDTRSPSFEQTYSKGYVTQSYRLDPDIRFTDEVGGWDSTPRCLTDLWRQFMSLGSFTFGPVEHPPDFGSLGSNTDGKTLCLLYDFGYSVSDVDGDRELKLTHKVRRWQQDAYSGIGHVVTFDHIIREHAHHTPHVPTDLIPETSWVQSRTQAFVQNWSYNVFEDGDMSTWDRLPDTSSFYAEGPISHTVWVGVDGIVPPIWPRERKVFFGLARLGFQRRAQSLVSDDEDSWNSLYDKWVQTLEDDVRSLTPTNVFETIGDMRELNSLIPGLQPIDPSTASTLFRTAAKFIGAATLYNNFVLQPTLGELEVYSEAVKRYTEERSKNPFITSRGSVSRTVDDLTIRRSFKTYWLAPNFSSYHEALQNDILNQVRAGNLWDLVPFSWLIDYFTNIGDTIGRLDSAIHSLSAWPLYTVVSSKVTSHEDVNRAYDFINGHPTDRWEGSIERVYFERAVTLRPLYPRISIKSALSLSASRLANIGALFVNMI